ncbi:MAG: hypothetical protein AAF667_19625 [Pseudomonadota bacterium]
MTRLTAGLTVLFGMICFGVGFIVSELTHFYSAISLELTDDGRSSGAIPLAALPNRDVRGIAAAICHGEQFVASFEEFTTMGSARYAHFVCEN